MSTNPTLFATAQDGKLTRLDGSTRRVILDLPELMLVEFSFEAGGIGALHSHPHLQTSYVAEGTFEVTIDGELVYSKKATGKHPPVELIIEEITKRLPA